MFNGFTHPEENWSKLPHELIDALNKITSMGELKVVLYILRHTWGFQEFDEFKRITLDEFRNGRKRRDGTRLDNGTGMNVKTIRSGIKRAIAHGFIERVPDNRDAGRHSHTYRLCIIDFERVSKVDMVESDNQQAKSTTRSEKDTVERKNIKPAETARLPVETEQTTPPSQPAVLAVSSAPVFADPLTAVPLKADVEAPQADPFAPAVAHPTPVPPSRPAVEPIPVVSSTGPLTGSSAAVPSRVAVSAVPVKNPVPVVAEASTPVRAPDVPAGGAVSAVAEQSAPQVPVRKKRSKKPNPLDPDCWQAERAFARLREEADKTNARRQGPKRFGTLAQKEHFAVVAEVLTDEAELESLITMALAAECWTRKAMVNYLSKVARERKASGGKRRPRGRGGGGYARTRAEVPRDRRAETLEDGGMETLAVVPAAVG